MRFQVLNETTGEALETDSLITAFETADRWLKEAERKNDLPWCTAEVTVRDLATNAVVNFKTTKK